MRTRTHDGARRIRSCGNPRSRSRNCRRRRPIQAGISAEDERASLGTGPQGKSLLSAHGGDRSADKTSRWIPASCCFPFLVPANLSRRAHVATGSEIQPVVVVQAKFEVMNEAAVTAGHAVSAEWVYPVRPAVFILDLNAKARHCLARNSRCAPAGSIHRTGCREHGSARQAPWRSTPEP